MLFRTSELFEFLTEERIVRSVIRKRISLAKKQHDLHFFHNMNNAAHSPFAGPCQVRQMMPPRRNWKRPNAAVRLKLSPSRCAELAIERCIRDRRNQLPQAAWQKHLKRFVGRVRVRARVGWIGKPHVHFVPKAPGMTTNIIYRPIAVYGLLDSILIGLVAKYLRGVVDPCFEECSYAFRAPCKGKSSTHHDAVENLIGFVKKHQGKMLYVAECDIQKFYDSVSHRTARKQLAMLLKEHSLRCDRKALRLFNAYLRSYTFKGTAERSFHKRGYAASGSLPWVSRPLKAFYRNRRLPRSIGVPQGGALSTVIANIVLHAADLAVLNQAKKEGLILGETFYYARYCDDMIIVSTDQGSTERLFASYLRKLDDLKLPHHPPEPVGKFSKSFFDAKSKCPYAYGSPNAGADSPWISFLGYQLRYDGRLRIRKPSMQKELDKQQELQSRILSLIERNGRPMRVSAAQATHRTQMRLIAMAVGKVALWRHGPDHDHAMCWASGFVLLKRHACVESQLKQLDRRRHVVLRRLRRRLRKLVKKLPAKDAAKMEKRLRYYGRPFSYYGQFRDKTSGVDQVGDPI